MKKDDINISVIIPVYNAAGYISDCLDSLMKQTLMPTEIIVVDNGSSDSTPHIVKEYNKIRLIYEKSPGASKARNRGAQEAKGNILAFLDADCQADSNWIKEAVKVFERSSNIDGFVGYSYGINKNLWAYLFQLSYDQFISEILSADSRLIKIDTKNFFINKNVFFEAGAFNVSIGNSEDAEFGIRLHRKKYMIVYSNDVKVSHLNPVNLDSRIRVRREQGFFDYKIYKNIGGDEALLYYPSFGRWYSRIIFVDEGYFTRILLRLFNLLSDVFIFLCRAMLIALQSAGCTKSLYPLYYLLMAFVIFQGKILSRSVEAGYITIEKVHAKLSRRLI